MSRPRADSRAPSGILRWVMSDRAPTLHRRVQTLDWQSIDRDLDSLGHAVVRGLLDPTQCAALAALYGDEGRFRSRVIMARHGFGLGEYQYFARPLPPVIATLREAAYPPL